MEWKPYIGYKEIMACGVSKGSAYSIIDDVMQMIVQENGTSVPWKNTYESRMVNGKTKKKIPTDLLLKKLPHCKKFFTKAKEKTQAL